MRTGEEGDLYFSRGHFTSIESESSQAWPQGMLSLNDPTRNCCSLRNNGLTTI